MGWDVPGCPGLQPGQLPGDGTGRAPGVIPVV